QGPKSGAVINAMGAGLPLPANFFTFTSVTHATDGELHCMNQPRGQALGFELFVPVPALARVADQLIAAARQVGGRAAGWQALEMIRIEAGFPRYGVDMDDTNLPPEAGIDARAVS